VLKDRIKKARAKAKPKPKPKRGHPLSNVASVRAEYEEKTLREDNTRLRVEVARLTDEVTELRARLKNEDPT
jgi:hypothetical protein